MQGDLKGGNYGRRHPGDVPRGRHGSTTWKHSDEGEAARGPPQGGTTCVCLLRDLIVEKENWRVQIEIETRISRDVRRRQRECGVAERRRGARAPSAPHQSGPAARRPRPISARPTALRRT